MAPELLGFVESGEESDSRNAHAADIWALGEIAFQMLTKKSTLTYIRSPDNLPSAVLRAHHVSEAGISFINDIMQPKPEDRQTTMEALLQAWMEPYNSHITGKTSIISQEYVLNSL